MSALELSLVLIVLGFFVLIVFLSIRGERLKRVRKKARALELGFQPLAEAPSSIQRRIDWLHKHHPSQKLELHNLSVLERADHSLFIFDLMDVGGSEVSALQNDAILVISSALALPRFTMVTKIQQGGILAEWANKAIKALAARQGYQVIPLRDSGIHDRFLVFSADPARTTSFFERFSPPVSRADSYAAIEAGGDAFSYGTLPVPSQTKSAREPLLARVREAEQWLRLFRKAGS